MPQRSAGRSVPTVRFCAGRARFYGFQHVALMQPGAAEAICRAADAGRFPVSRITPAGDSLADETGITLVLWGQPCEFPSARLYPAPGRLPSFCVAIGAGRRGCGAAGLNLREHLPARTRHTRGVSGRPQGVARSINAGPICQRLEHILGKATKRAGLVAERNRCS
jgi:hypothetical protein